MSNGVTVPKSQAAVLRSLAEWLIDFSVLLAIFPPLDVLLIDQEKAQSFRRTVSGMTFTLDDVVYGALITSAISLGVGLYLSARAVDMESPAKPVGE